MKMNIYFSSILFCIAISHGFPHKDEDPEYHHSDAETDSFDPEELVSIEKMLLRLSEIASNNLTTEDIYNLTSIGDLMDVEPRFVKKAAIASAVAAVAFAAHTSFNTFLSFLPFFKFRKVVTVAPDATAVIVPGTSRKVNGRLLFFNVDHGINIVGEIRGLTPGRHGMHVHRMGNLGNFCSSASSHFNPTNLCLPGGDHVSTMIRAQSLLRTHQVIQSNHGGPSASIRHIGDLGNIVANQNGVAQIDIFDRLISLDPKSAHYIGNRAIVIHADEDDLGLGVAGDKSTLDSGNSGSRVGCGLIVQEFTRHF